jgi:hypothetical protein
MKILALLMLLIPSVCVAEQVECDTGEFRPLDACYAQYCRLCTNMSTGEEFISCEKVLRPRTGCIVSDKIKEDRRERMRDEEETYRTNNRGA